ncbi:shikimate dehydrogenase [Jiangella anatolica]|uniref:Shikimate dehydrogenase n=1 Tax=Jiangella anatolica TaxID=2670374 RepID=A0A2W2BYY1_9ACTN|nr:shikimate dehydrogenase [Jiangella anatolica]PZF80837.1 shikimate dehydrogenase [Jiangella anatolica]
MTHDDRLIDVGGVRRWAGPGELVVFVGVATGGSRSHDAFPAWAATLSRPDWTLRGLDLPPTTPAPAYVELVEAIAANPRVAGAVVTSHKLRLHRAATGRFRRTDALTTLMHEVNTLVRAGDGVDAHARDPLALAAVLRDRPAPGDVVVYGAGGAGTALLLALTLDVEATLAAGAPVRGGRHRVTVLDTDEAALAALRTTAERCGVTDRLTLLDARTPAPIPPRALVVNATGLGKDRPGSPLPPGAVLPATATAWDFNYRGDLTFLADARASGVAAVDGWDYFVAGWGAALTAIAGRPLTAGLLAELGEAYGRK